MKAPDEMNVCVNYNWEDCGNCTDGGGSVKAGCYKPITPPRQNRPKGLLDLVVMLQTGGTI